MYNLKGQKKEISPCISSNHNDGTLFFHAESALVKMLAFERSIWSQFYAQNSLYWLRQKMWVNTNTFGGVESNFPAFFSPSKQEFEKEMTLEIEKAKGLMAVLSPHG